MSIKINFNTHDFIEYIEDATIVYDKLSSAMFKCLLKNMNKETLKIAREYRKDPLYKKLEIWK